MTTLNKTKKCPPLGQAAGCLDAFQILIIKIISILVPILVHVPHAKCLINNIHAVLVTCIEYYLVGDELYRVICAVCYLVLLRYRRVICVFDIAS